MEVAARTLLVGIGATAAMDVWALLARRLWGMPASNWALVGRWFGHFAHGRFRHDSIAAAPAIPGELAIGWSAHYVTGIAYAAVLVGIAGTDWLRAPTPLPAVLMGLATLAAPFLLMQPGMGSGIAASRTPAPGAARLRSVLNHTVFGLGLYASALAM